MVTKNDFVTYCKELIYHCHGVMKNNEDIRHYVLCCWVSPFGTTERRIGYFEDRVEATEFYNSLMIKYAWSSHKLITNETGDSYFEWED